MSSHRSSLHSPAGRFIAAGALIVLAINLCGAVGLVPGEHPEGHEHGEEHAAMAHSGHGDSHHAMPTAHGLSAAPAEHESCPAHGCCSLLAKKESRAGGLDEPALIAGSGPHQARFVALRARFHPHYRGPCRGAPARIPLRL